MLQKVSEIDSSKWITNCSLANQYFAYLKTLPASLLSQQIIYPLLVCNVSGNSYGNSIQITVQKSVIDSIFSTVHSIFLQVAELLWINGISSGDQNILWGPVDNGTTSEQALQQYYSYIRNTVGNFTVIKIFSYLKVKDYIFYNLK